MSPCPLFPFIQEELSPAISSSSGSSSSSNTHGGSKFLAAEQLLLAHGTEYVGPHSNSTTANAANLHIQESPEHLHCIYWGFVFTP